METLSRQEYPAALASLPPSQAVATLNERVKRIGRVNTEIADWLMERRKVEEIYIQGLKKLAHKPLPDNQSELGIFTTPWQKIVQSAESIAQSHQNFSMRIEKDVEQPLRSYATKNREMQAMSTIQGNLSAMAKELDEAQQRADKLSKKGGKANSFKVDSASQKLDNANSQWDSQAPFVFEKLQALDETRLNHLRDVLTQYQTHEADKVEQNRITAESTLNSLLEVNTALEIQNFARNTTQGKPKLERNRRTSSSAGSNTVPQGPPRPAVEDDTSEQSGKIESSSESRGGLKRLGTMLGRRRQSVHGSFMRAPSPTKGGYSPFGRAPGSREGRPSPSPRASSSNLRDSSSRGDNRLSALAEAPSSPTNPLVTSQSDRRASKDAVNGEFTGFKPGSLLNPDTIIPKSSTSDNINGNASGGPSKSSEYQPPPGPPPSHLKNNIVSPSQLDSEGFSVPAAANDPISLAQKEAASAGDETDQPQFKLDIKNEPIREEDADARAALSSVANTLRSSTIATPSRKAGTVRGRRDVRNTIFVPAPTDVSEVKTENAIPLSPEQSFGSARSPALAHLEHSTSDTQSIHSQRSLTGVSVIKHPDLNQPGLNSSIIETVSASLENGEVKSGTVIGEVALAFGRSESTPLSSFGTETIRLNNFAALEAIAPNHAFVHEVSPDKPGEYTVNTSNISKATVAFRYKVHVDSANLSNHCPLLLKPAWRPQGDKLSFIIEYSLNPAFATGPITINNLVLMATYEGAKIAGCQTKPAGTLLKEKNLIYWRVGDVTLDAAGTAHKVIGRLVGAEGGEPKPGLVEVRWEVGSSNADSAALGHVLGSGLGISRLEAGKEKEKDTSDPFADESISSGVAASNPHDSSSGGDGMWVVVESARRAVSGKYDARQAAVDTVALPTT